MLVYRVDLPGTGRGGARHREQMIDERALAAAGGAKESDAQLAARQTMPLKPLLQDLRRAAERLEAAPAA